MDARPPGISALITERRAMEESHVAVIAAACLLILGVLGMMGAHLHCRVLPHRLRERQLDQHRRIDKLA